MTETKYQPWIGVGNPDSIKKVDPEKAYITPTGLFDSFDEAKGYLLSRAKEHVISLENQLKCAQNRLQEINELTE
jgi:hypothetical protein